MQADFAEEGLIDLSHAAKGGDPEKTEGWKCQKRAFERAKSRIKGSGIIKLERTKQANRLSISLLEDDRTDSFQLFQLFQFIFQRVRNSSPPPIYIITN